MISVSIQEIQRDPAGYLRRVEAGETILIVRGERPVAEIKPVSALPRQPRPFGLCAGEFVVLDHFDDPLSESVLKDFEGE
jgi:prevent-host-death family protein